TPGPAPPTPGCGRCGTWSSRNTRAWTSACAPAATRTACGPGSPCPAGGLVPIDPEQELARMLTSANRCRTGRSVLEPPVGQPVVYFQDLRLTGRFLAPQREEADLVLVQIHLAAHQTIGPHLAERPTPTQQGHLAAAVAAPQE